MEATQQQAAPGAHVSSLPASIEDKIADELGRSGISGYELSCRYGVSKHLVDKIGRAHMGGVLYGERDKRAMLNPFNFDHLFIHFKPNLRPLMCGTFSPPPLGRPSRP